LIISRPQTGNLISFIFFFIISYAVVFINLLTILYDPHPQWLNYLIVIVLTPIAFFISYKVIFRYKIIRIDNGRIEVRYPLFRIRKTYTLKDILYWKESIIKTGKTSTFKELEIKFIDNRKITMGYREYVDYEKMVNYLSGKVPKLKKS
jgi:hypothetical protein